MEGEIKVGDDVTVGGKVVEIANGAIHVELKSEIGFWVLPSDIKTHRPGRDQGEKE